MAEGTVRETTWTDLEGSKAALGEPTADVVCFGVVLCNAATMAVCKQLIGIYQTWKLCGRCNNQVLDIEKFQRMPN